MRGDSADAEAAPAQLVGAADVEALRRLATTVGEEFFLEGLSLLRAGVGVAHAFVGELRGDDPDHVHVLAMVRAGGKEEPFEYDLRDTPCEQLVQQSTCAYASGVADAFPRDVMLRQMGIESYVGTTLLDRDGLPLGLLVLLHTEALEGERVAAAEAALASLRTRFEGELRRRCAEHELGLVIEDAWSPNQTPMRAVVDTIARALHVPAVLVARRRDTQPPSSRIVASRLPSSVRAVPSILDDRDPCASVYGAGEVHYDSGVRERFPDSALVRALDAESFSAVVLHDSLGRPIGHLITASDRPSARPRIHTGIFRVLATRVALELERASAHEEKRALERHLYEAQRRESLGQLAGGIAHDFNNLLTVIGGSSELLALSMGVAADDQQYLKEILEATDHAADLCRQMMAYAGRDVHLTRRLDLAPVVHDLAKLMGAAIPKKCVLRIEAPEGRAMVQGDLAQVRQVVMNLIKNAADAVGDAPGWVEVQVTRRRLRDGDLEGEVFGEPLAEGDYVVLRVRDTGSGMPPDRVPRIFDPYFTTKIGGHGLGLASVLGIVRAHQGVVAVDTELGRGTTFTVVIPHADAASEEVLRPDAAEPEGTAGGRVLLVDDEMVIRRSAAAILTREGFEVVTAENGRDAVELFSREGGDFACVILDVTMPVMGGDEAAVRMAELHPEVPIILSSGYATKEVRDRLRAHPPFGILKKPYRFKDLVRLVRRAAASAGAGRPPTAVDASA